MKRIFTVTLLVALMLAVDVFACTSAIFTGKATPDGRPLLWKHRDTGEPNNRIQYFKGEKYTFYALINSPDFFRNDRYVVWAGPSLLPYLCCYFRLGVSVHREWISNCFTLAGRGRSSCLRRCPG